MQFAAVEQREFTGRPSLLSEGPDWAENFASPVSTSDENKTFINNKDDDFEGSESESECSSAFEAGRSFWLNLLDRTDSASISTEEGSRNRKTPSSRGVGRTWSTSSSISGGSAFNNKKKGGKTVAAAFQQFVNNFSQENGESRRKVTVGSKWKNSPHGSNRPPTPALPSIIKSKTAFTFALPPTPSQQVNNSTSTPTQNRRSTPRAFGDDVTNLSTTSTPRTPASVSNTPNTGQLRRHGSALSESSQRDRYTPSPASKIVQPPNEFRTYSSTKKKFQRDSSTQDRSSLIPKVDTLVTTKSPSGARIFGSQEGEVDPIIEAGRISTPTSVHSITGELGKMNILKVSPRSDLRDRFQWAYDSWSKVGLMDKKAQPKRTISPRVISSMSKFQFESGGNTISPNPPPFTVNKNKAEAPKEQTFPFSNRPNVDKESTTLDAPESATSKKKDESLKTNDASAAADSDDTKASRQNKNDSYPDLEPMSSTESDHSGFQDILKQWRVKSDDKPNTHFLSPEQEAKALEVYHGRYEEHLMTTKRPLDDEFKETQIVPHGSGLVDSDIYENGDCSVEDDGCRALVILDNNQSFELVVNDTSGSNGQELVIRNVERISADHETALVEYVPCECSKSVFSGNDDLISFFLPQMGMACTCGRNHRGLVNFEEPTAIENVLRPWQVEFLKSFGIHRGDQLVKARHRSGDVLARALRQWRKQKNMAPFKTASCGMAINIWAKTCKTYVRSIRKQVETGTVLLERQPEIVLRELSQFLTELPPAPPKRRTPTRLAIEPESQMEV